MQVGALSVVFLIVVNRGRGPDGAQNRGVEGKVACNACAIRRPNIGQAGRMQVQPPDYGQAAACVSAGYFSVSAVVWAIVISMSGFGVLMPMAPTTVLPIVNG